VAKIGDLRKVAAQGIDPRKPASPILEALVLLLSTALLVLLLTP
jgi:hypothetical protein